MSKNLPEKIDDKKVIANEPMAEHVYFKAGGPAEYFYDAGNSEELERAARVALDSGIQSTVIGNGANVLVSDKGVKGLVIKNTSEKIKFLPHGFVEADSGVDNTNLIRQCKDRGLIGTEKLLKVPGTVGGAIFMNAGDTGRQRFFEDLVVSVEVVDKDGNKKRLTKDECDFSYRSSRFQKSGEIILKAKLFLKQATKSELEETAKDILVRKMYQPAGASVGSTFKNPVADYAGRLIEESGLKGKVIGKAKISEKHANFIINQGGAKAEDAKALIDLMKKAVKEKFDVDLEEEVRYTGEW